MANSVVECMSQHAKENPSKLCLADARQSLDYKTAWECVQGCADLLLSWGCSKGDYVLVECTQNVDYMIWMLASHLAGVIAVPLEKNSAEARVAEIAEETGAQIRVGRVALDGLGLTHYASKLATQHDVEADFHGWAFPESEDVAEILFSTGTTGKSKGIVITHRNNMAIAENVITGLGIKPNNVEIVPMPLSHSHGLRRTYANLVNGSSAVIAEGVLALKKLFQLMDAHKVTAMDLSPSMLSIIFKLSKERLGEYADMLDYVQLGSAPLPEEDKAHLKRLLPETRLYNFYGSTEAGCSCLLEFGRSPDKVGCIGKPCVNAQFIVVDDQRRPIRSSAENLGLLANSGAINMRCYFNAPELTAETMQDGFIYTKDLGYIDEEGFVYMLGRKDDVINFGGVKIAPEEIETAVAKAR